MLLLLGFSSLLALAASICDLPPAPADLPWASYQFARKPLSGGRVNYVCPSGTYIVGTFGIDGPLVGLFIEDGTVSCSSSDGIYRTGGVATKLTTMGCADFPLDDGFCAFDLEGNLYMALNGQSNIKCPAGFSLFAQSVVESSSLSCRDGDMIAHLVDGRNEPVGVPDVKCVEASKMCALPPVPYPPKEMPVVQPYREIASILPSSVTFKCPSCGETQYLYGNLGVGGSLVYTSLQSVTCNDGKYNSNMQFTTLACAKAPDVASTCSFVIVETTYLLDSGAEFQCPPGQQTRYKGSPIPKLSCSNGKISYPNAQGAPVPIQGTPTIACYQLPTTTSTTTTTTRKPVTTTTSTTSTTTTTTVAPTTTTINKVDVPLNDVSLINLAVWYNYGVAVHAFCTDPDATCYDQMQGNGIGYDPVNGKLILGRVVKESQIAAVRSSCPNGSKHLQPLYFKPVGQHYEHNYNGYGIKTGSYVSTVAGACGATVGLRRWKSRVADDMYYHTDLEYHAWYKGLIQDGGNVQFYIWPTPQ